MPDNPFFEKARTLAEADFPVEQSDLADSADTVADVDDAEVSADAPDADASEPVGPAGGGAD